MIVLTLEQRECLLHGQPVRITVPEAGGPIVLLPEAAYCKLQEQVADEQEQAAWVALTQQAAGNAIVEAEEGDPAR